MPGTAPRSILIVDDHPLFRKGAVELIALDAGLCLAGEAASGRQGLELARVTRPDLILLDINMKDMNGLEALQAIRAERLEALVVVLTVSDSEEDVVAALQAGADGYLLKDMEPEAILERLHAALDGHLVVSDALTELIARALRDQGRGSKPNTVALTAREREILRLLGKGLSNKRIAQALEITESTVKVHVKHLLKKLKLRSRVEAALWVTRQAG